MYGRNRGLLNAHEESSKADGEHSRQRDIQLSAVMSGKIRQGYTRLMRTAHFLKSGCFEMGSKS